MRHERSKEGYWHVTNVQDWLQMAEVHCSWDVDGLNCEESEKTMNVLDVNTVTDKHEAVENIDFDGRWGTVSSKGVRRVQQNHERLPKMKECTERYERW